MGLSSVTWSLLRVVPEAEAGRRAAITYHIASYRRVATYLQLSVICICCLLEVCRECGDSAIDSGAVRLTSKRGVEELSLLPE